MKKAFLIFIFIVAAGAAFAQRKKPAKLSKEQSANMTQDQRFVHESSRKSNRHNKTSVKRKVKIQKQQHRKSSRIRPPKRRGKK